jgi:hypothetical protein
VQPRIADASSELFRDVIGGDLVALSCRSEEPSARRIGRPENDLRSVRLSLRPGIRTDSLRNSLSCSTKRQVDRKPPSETNKEWERQYRRQGRNNRSQHGPWGKALRNLVHGTERESYWERGVRTEGVVKELSQARGKDIEFAADVTKDNRSGTPLSNSRRQCHGE